MQPTRFVYFRSDPKVKYTLLASAAGAAQVVTRSNVFGAAGAAAVINVTQTPSASGATANLTVDGVSYAMGDTLPGGVGVSVYQNSPAAYLSVMTTANAPGHTINIAQ